MPTNRGSTPKPASAVAHVVAERVGPDLREDGAALAEPGGADGDVRGRAAEEPVEGRDVRRAGPDVLRVPVDAGRGRRRPARR